MTREEKQKAIDALKISAPVMPLTQEEFNDYIQTINKVMDWLEQEPYEDCISKSQALKEMEESAKHHANDSREEALLRRDRDIIRALPPVKPQEPKTGHWIYDNFIWRCSECNETPKTMGYVGTADFMTEHFKFCNHCGARMIEPQDGGNELTELTNPFGDSRFGG